MAKSLHFASIILFAVLIEGLGNVSFRTVFHDHLFYP